MITDYVKFAGFSAEALAERMVDAKCIALVTADGSYRGSKLIQLKEIAAEALEKCQKRFVHTQQLLTLVPFETSLTSTSSA